MQQKTILRLRSGLMVSKAEPSKFIIFIALICFISFLFFPTRVWGVGEASGGSGGGSECVQTCQSYTCSGCPDISYTGPGAFYCPAYWDGSDCCSYSCKKCDKWKPETIPSWCFDTTTTTKDDREPGWHCNTITESCYYGKKQTSGYKTQEQCEAQCIYCRYCRNKFVLFWWSWGEYGCYGIKKCSDNIDECTTHAECTGGTPPPPTVIKYSCNTSTWTCSENSNGVYSSLSTCESNCSAWSPPPVSPPPVSPPPVSPPPVSPPPVSPPVSECEIYEFSINGNTNKEKDPLLVWVNASLKGRISTDADCTKCTVESTDTWGNPNPVEYAMTFANNYNAEESFKIPESGTYSFTVKCIGNPADPMDFDEDTVSLKTVQAINLPWWREIIPVLPGFLRGMFR